VSAELQNIKSPALFRRVWAMPSADTFNVPPIAGFVKKYLMHSVVSVDPFSRNKRWATHTNDLNPDTSAQHHMDAEDFLLKLKCEGVFPDLVIFDPPYSIGQIVTTYASFGIDRDAKGTHNGALYSRTRDAIRQIIHEGSIVLSFGWNSCGMGVGWEIIELLLVAHGGAHNDTICMAERKLPPEPDMFSTL